MLEKQLWLIRHGESEANTGVTSEKPHESLLTKKGVEQALHAAAQIDIQPDLLIVSPATRAVATAKPIIERWPSVKIETWPIQELVYLSPAIYHHLSLVERKIAVTDFWQRCDPYYHHGHGAESIADFLARVQQFHDRIKQYNGFTVVVGHGLFFSAYQLGLSHGYTPSAELMKLFREEETAHPIRNGEIIKLR